MKWLFRLLPVAGVLCLLMGFTWAIGIARFDARGAGLIGLGVALLLTLPLRSEVANLKYYVHLFAYSTLVVGVCVVAYLFVCRHDVRWDLTAQQRYSLSPASVRFLHRLDKDVSVTIFTDLPDPFFDIREIYTAESERVRFAFHNARLEPLVARRFGDAVRNGEVFIQCGERVKQLSVTELGDDYERTLGNALVEVAREGEITVYFLEGRGEIAWARSESVARAEQAPPTLQAFREFLERRAIRTRTLDLTRVGRVPRDASLVIEAGPMVDPTTAEVAALEAYLRRNGRLLVLLDPPTRHASADPMERLRALLARHGVATPNEIVVDFFSEQVGGSAALPLLAYYDPKHPITRPLAERPSRTVLTMSRPVRPGATPGDTEAIEIVKSSPKSWSTDLTAIMGDDVTEPPRAEDLAAQPLGVAVAKATPPKLPGGPTIPQPPPGPRLVVYGNSMLMDDAFLTASQAGVELMLNTVDWLLERDDTIAAAPRRLEGTPIVLDQAQLRLIFALAVALIPGALFFGGVGYSLWRRKG